MLTIIPITRDYTRLLLNESIELRAMSLEQFKKKLTAHSKKAYPKSVVRCPLSVDLINKTMKKLLLTITLILCGMTSFAQSDYSVIKGNVAEKNVYITIINTSFGVSSDDNADFIMMLP